VVVYLYLTVIFVGKPYLRKGDDRLHLFAQLEILLFLLAGNTSNFSPIAPGSSFDILMSFVLIVLILLFLSFFLFQGFIAFRKVIKDRKKRHTELDKHDALENDHEHSIASQQSMSSPSMNSQIGGAHVLDEDGEVIEYYKKPLLAKIIPDKMWTKWPLKKYITHKQRLTKPIDTGRFLLMGIDHIDRRRLQPHKNKLEEQGGGGSRLRNESYGGATIRGVAQNHEREREIKESKKPPMEMIKEQDSPSKDRGSMNEQDVAGAAWAEAGAPMD